MVPDLKWVWERRRGAAYRRHPGHKHRASRAHRGRRDGGCVASRVLREDWRRDGSAGVLRGQRRRRAHQRAPN